MPIAKVGSSTVSSIMQLLFLPDTCRFRLSLARLFEVVHFVLVLSCDGHSGVRRVRLKATTADLQMQENIHFPCSQGCLICSLLDSDENYGEVENYGQSKHQ